MSVVTALIQRAFRAAVQPARDDRRASGDDPAAAAPGGTGGRSSGDDAACRARAARLTYLGVAAVVAAFTLVDGFSKAQEIGWRLATPGNLWEPLLWNGTSGAVILALLPLARRAGMVAPGLAARPLVATVLLLGLALTFAAIHIGLMFPLRKLAYAAAGWDYTINWSLDRVVYELRKDVVSFAVMASLFWLAERRQAPAPAVGVAPPPGPSDFWLRDGKLSVLVDPREIVSVSSAGNYVEYVLTGGRRHLIRATLQAEATRLQPFGLARVHRTRLVNLARVIALEARPSGDFALRLDTGDTIVGSRRFKAAVARLGG